MAPCAWKGIPIGAFRTSTTSLPPPTGTGPFDYPYLSLPGMARYLPPTLEQARAECNVIVTNDWHRQLYSKRFQVASPETAAKWRRFYHELEETYPPIVLKSPAPAGSAGAARELRIYALSKVKASP